MPALACRPLHRRVRRRQHRARPCTPRLPPRFLGTTTTPVHPQRHPSQGLKPQWRAGEITRNTGCRGRPTTCALSPTPALALCPHFVFTSSPPELRAEGLHVCVCGWVGKVGAGGGHKLGAGVGEELLVRVAAAVGHRPHLLTVPGGQRGEGGGGGYGYGRRNSSSGRSSGAAGRPIPHAPPSSLLAQHV